MAPEKVAPRDAARHAMTNILRELNDYKNLKPIDIAKKTRAARNLLDKFPGVFQDKMEGYKQALPGFEKYAEKKLRKELIEEIPEDAKPHLEELANNMAKVEEGEIDLVDVSRNLMLHVNKETISKMAEEGIQPEDLELSKKVLFYLEFVHDLLEEDNKEHLGVFKKVLKKAEEFVEKK